MDIVRPNPTPNQDKPEKIGHTAYAVTFLLAALVVALLAALFGVGSGPGAALTVIALCSLALGIRALVSGR